MYRQLFLSLIALTYLGSNAYAQNLDEMLDALEKRIQKATVDVAKDPDADKHLQELLDIEGDEVDIGRETVSQYRSLAADQAKIIRKLKLQLDAIEATASQNTGNLRQLEEKVENTIVKNTKELEDRVEDLRRIVNDISAEGPGGYVPNLGQIQMNQPFGELTVRNQMKTVQKVAVNGVEYWVQPLGETVTVPVRPGVVSTSLPGYEAPRAWNVGPANGYKVHVDIVPRP